MRKIDITKLPPGLDLDLLKVACNEVKMNVAAMAEANTKTVLVVGYKVPNQQFTVDINKLKTISQEEFQKEVLTIAKAFGISANKVADIFRTLASQTQETTRSMKEVAEELKESITAMKYAEPKEYKSQSDYESQKKQKRNRNRNIRRSRW